MKMEITPKVSNPHGLPLTRACDWAEQLQKAGIENDGEKMFVLIFEIWTEAQKPFKSKLGEK